MGAGLICVRATRLFFTIITLALTQTVHALFVGGAAFRPFKQAGFGTLLEYLLLADSPNALKVLEVTSAFPAAP